MSDDLSRLRRQNNLLYRRLKERETWLQIENKKRDSRIDTLQKELSAIKESRVWRTAVRLRSLFPRPSLQNVSERASTRAARYQKFVKGSKISDSERASLCDQAKHFQFKPLISIVMPVYNVDLEAFEAALESVRQQIYDRWELCLVDDGSDQTGFMAVLGRFNEARVKFRRLNKRMNIADATNAALAMATGEYIAFMDHDDRLAPEALFEAASAINDTKPEFIYTDEDGIDMTGNRLNPHFKPDFSPDLLLSHNYITHFVVVARELVNRIGGLNSTYDGAQDYDFVLRATEQAASICHIPKVLYHWRMSEGSTSINPTSKPLAAERGRLAIKQALIRRGNGDAEVLISDVPHFYRVKYPVRNNPLVSVVIPFKDRPDLLHCVVGDILEKSTYENLQITGVSNNSTDRDTFDAMEDLSKLDERVMFVEHNVKFNFSALANFGVSSCRGSHIVLLNNDIRIISPGWVEALLEHSQRGEVGAVGGKLYYPDKRVQHAGVVVGINGYAGHSHKGFPADHQGYFNRLQVIQNVSAVTGAFMMVERSLYDSVGGFDAQQFPIACNDVDFCLRIREQGKWNVFTPYSEAYHIESASRGYEDTPEKKERFDAERKRFIDRHGWIVTNGDPCYNPNLTREAEDFSVRISAEC